MFNITLEKGEELTYELSNVCAELRAVAAVSENTSALEDLAFALDELRESQDSKESKSDSHVCDCGKAFDSPQAYGGHVANCTGEKSEKSQEGGDSKTDLSWIESVSDVRTYAKHDSEKAREGLRAMKAGRKEWVEVFGTCEIPGCEYGCNSYGSEVCNKHDESDKTPDSDGMPTTNTRVDELMDAGASYEVARMIARGE